MRRLANETKLFYKQHFVDKREIYTMHDHVPNAYQDVTELIEMLDGESLPILMYDYQCEKDVTIPYHWHEYYEMIYIFEGKVDVHFENKVYPLAKGDYFYFPSGVMHQTENTIGAHVLVMHIKQDYVKKRLPDWESLSVSFESFTEDTDRVHKQNEEISSLITELYQAFNDEMDLARSGTQGLLDYIFYRLGAYYGKEEAEQYTISEKYKERLLKIFDYVDEHLCEKIELNDLAKHLAVSPQYLSRIFRKYLDTTFMHYVNEQRLEKAMKDLVYSDLTLTDIALDYGFSNYHAFVRTCKEKHGMTPSEYRKTHQPKND